MTISQLAPERALRRLELTVVRRLEGYLHGEHLGLLPGPGTELAEAREYQVGDDVRRMDWAVTARTTVPHVRDLIEQKLVAVRDKVKHLKKLERELESAHTSCTNALASCDAKPECCPVLDAIARTRNEGTA